MTGGNCNRPPLRLKGTSGAPARINDEGRIAGECDRLEGGFKKPSVQDFVPVIQNAEDLIWKDEDFTTVQEETEELIVVDNI